MEVSEADLFYKTYADHYAIIFTDHGIVVDLETSSPVLEYSNTVEKLELTVSALHLDGSMLFINAHSTLTTDQFLNNGFHIHNAKTFLASTEEEKCTTRNFACGSLVNLG